MIKSKYKTNIGDKIHKWEVVSDIMKVGKRIGVMCECECKRTRQFIRYESLLFNQTKSCLKCANEKLAKDKRKGTLADNGIKKCCVCLLDKDIKEYRKYKTTEDGLHYACQRCENNSRIVKLYGINNDYYDKLFQSQDYRCEICHKNQKDLEIEGDCWFCIDHDHDLTFPHARGILCSKCNSMIGLAHDSIETLENAIRYLQNSKLFIFTDNSIQQPEYKEIRERLIEE